MSRHDPSISLRQMRDHAHELADIVRGHSRGDLDTYLHLRSSGRSRSSVKGRPEPC
jgi:hypothetical protein